MNGKTVFKADRQLDPELDYAFEKMIQKISFEAKISPQLLRKYGGEAFKDWESKTGKPISSLNAMKPEDRSSNIYAILDKFRHSLEHIVPSVRKMDKTMCIASVSMEIMFGS
ncbi:hypothetical protein NEF87_004057 [Candidatus Lokiarchaeum ossiferum]|uniref:Uncharacterized protein n=1 Tax=Candidatus Lokiarchaeum ossiferum TaxID=2951803 RepID=A0ABY6HY30_9ARCH|nr:hypothetical protein NEF87_004057 [Candidatus Lokiarchaeum sp. B-35]